MSAYPKTMEQLIERLMYLSGIGRKSAQKLALDIVEMDSKRAKEIAQGIQEVKEKIVFCKICHHLSEEEKCPICADARRDEGLICVVDGPRDVIAIERIKEFKGRYHVLHGVLSPLNGVGVQELMIDSLLQRVEEGNIREVILANSPTLEGEATAIYLSKVLKDKVPVITRIAHGVPIGGDLEFADEITLLKSIQSRKSY